MASTLALLSTPSSPQSALELIDVCKRFGRDALALAPTNLTLNQGETVGLIGPNGAGKSTLLKIAAGVWSSDSGVVKYQGHPRRWPDSARLCGYAGQNTSLDPDMSGRELLRFFADLHGVTKARVCDDLIHDLGLIGQADKLIATWSGGMRRRLHVGIALLHQPPILILDEPTNGLDPDGREQLWSQLNPGRHPTRSVLIAGHDLAEMGRVCQRVAVMSQGAILAYDRPQQLIAQHGGYRLDVHLETPPSARVFTRIQALDEVQRATVRAARLTVTCHSQTGLDQVLGQLQQSPHEPLDLRRQAPGLASVYFNLTGHDAWQAGPPTRRRPQ